MYRILLLSHSVFRWLVLISLLCAIFKAYQGYRSRSPFTQTDNVIRHWTATIAHVQLMIGIVLYTQSPVVRVFTEGTYEAASHPELPFFGLIHVLLMLIAIILITLGSALAKRKQEATSQFRTMLIWFSVALFVILLAIPWPFSPFAQRPYIRPF